MRENNKGIIHLLPLLLVGVLIIGAGVGMYFLGKNSGQPIVFKASPSPEASTQPTTSPYPEKITIPAEKGAELDQIKYNLPQGWNASISEGSLLITATGGGYFSITVHDYDEQTGRRDYFCKVREVCIESSRFTAIKIGNIPGYMAESLDNSGGGAEYFGAKGNKFYIIASFAPPSPSEFESNKQKVLDSLVF